MNIATPDGVLVRRIGLPGPTGILVGLLGASALRWSERWALVRMLTGLRRQRWRGFDGMTVAQLLRDFRQPPALESRLWDPLCIAALNTPMADACAQSFVNVLRDSLGAPGGASDFLIPTSTLGAVFPEPAAHWLERNGACLRLRTPVRGIEPVAGNAGRWRVRAGTPESAAFGLRDHSALVLAVPPPNAARLLAGLAPGVAAALDAFAFDAIATVYLGWREEPTLAAVTMLNEDAQREHFGQWLFDRGRQAGWRLGAVVISAHGRHAAISPAVLAQRIAEQVAAQLRIAPPAATRVLTEKRATWRCVPGRPRLEPGACTIERPELSGLWLAGDHVYPDYPATLEGAVRSAVIAARGLAKVLAGGALPG